MLQLVAFFVVHVFWEFNAGLQAFPASASPTELSV